MKTFPGIVIILALGASIGFSKDDLGPFADARRTWPEAFVPGKFSVANHAGEELYAFAGEAESFFTGEFAESDAELFEEATLDAKARFLKTMTKDDPARSIVLSGLRVAYRWAEGPLRRVVCVVLKKNVSVVAGNPAFDKPKKFISKDVPSVATVSCAPKVKRVQPSCATNGLPDIELQAALPCGEVLETNTSDAASADETQIEAKIRVCRERLTERPDDPFIRLRLARLFAQSGQSARATRHYRALVSRLASDKSAMPLHDAASTMVEAAEHARATGNDAQALKFYRSAWKIGDPNLQPRITAEISLLLLKLN